MSDPPIIITNGSITIEFDAATLRQKGDGRFYNPNKKVRYIEITGDNINFSQEVPSGGKLVIKIHYSSDIS